MDKTPLKKLDDKNIMILSKYDDIVHFQMLKQRAAMRLEAIGLRFKGGSVTATVKRRYGFTGNRQRVIDQFSALISEKYPEATGGTPA
jgi:hypothetical protein